jgi:hypothetical protein
MTDLMQAQAASYRVAAHLMKLKICNLTRLAEEVAHISADNLEDVVADQIFSRCKRWAEEQVLAGECKDGIDWLANIPLALTWAEAPIPVIAALAALESVHAVKIDHQTGKLSNWCRRTLIRLATASEPKIESVWSDDRYNWSTEALLPARLAAKHWIDADADLPVTVEACSAGGLTPVLRVLAVLPVDQVEKLLNTKLKATCLQPFAAAELSTALKTGAARRQLDDYAHRCGGWWTVADEEQARVAFAKQQAECAKLSGTCTKKELVSKLVMCGVATQPADPSATVTSLLENGYVTLVGEGTADASVEPPMRLKYLDQKSMATKFAQYYPDGIDAVAEQALPSKKGNTGNRSGGRRSGGRGGGGRR